uniref:Endonuclease/exonuclease/phosphatase domain-containing protein n=1 Tax=Trypanosoma congolense (strain IL3000) TaxID=1068625 RepID=G0UTK6_TRYCI|nr:conserved hypothetical protein [Trypanosoma congolense IL3000]
MLRSSFPRLDGSMVTGNQVKGLTGHMRSLIKPCIAERVLHDVAVMRQRLAEVVEVGAEDPTAAYKPLIPREWVKAPLSALSTSATRRDWFRLMQFNVMTDAWNRTGATSRTATPVHGVQPWVPGFTRPNTDPNSFCAYDSDLDVEVPPFLRQDLKRAYLVNEICYYDPDIVCLQEVNRIFFNDTLSKYIRYRGYGALYQSSRGYNVRALRKGDDPALLRHKGKIEEGEDIGNVVLFHKGRFVPILMPGKDLVQHLHFAHIVAMRDRVTNMTLNVACVQFTAGDSSEAVQIRLHEAKQVIQVLNALNRNDTDRAHMTNVVCGDFNNVDDEEACVQFLREQFFSMYDVVGGPRWTAWFHEDVKGSDLYKKYYDCNRAGYFATNATKRAEREVERFIRLRNTGVCCHKTEGGDRNDGAPKATPETHHQPSSVVHDGGGYVGPSPSVEEEPRRDEARLDALVAQRQALRSSGIIKRTQDFMLYDPATLALHQVLDVPEDDKINEQQLLPCSSHPSHHLHLVADVSFTDVFPDVGSKSLRD